MPRRVITRKGHDQNRSLGWLAVWWIETFVVHGRGGVAGKPIRYGDEYTSFDVNCYALEKSGKRMYNAAFFSRPKGTDKSGVAAALALFEAFGPCRFAGWAKGGEKYEFLGKTYVYSKGEPMGQPVVSPLVRIMATEEGQTGNTYESIYFNLTDDAAPLAQLVKVYNVDVGKTRVLMNNKIVIQPSTAGSASKDGGLETFVVFDESHLYNVPELREMFRVVSRNLRKRRKEGSWYIETTTMYAPGEESIAEETYQQADALEEGRSRRAGRLLFDHRWADVESLEPIKVPIDPEKFDPADESTMRLEADEEYLKRLSDAFIEAYGEAMTWWDVEDLLDGLFDTHQSEIETRRYFFNALVEDDNAWVSVALWDRVGLESLLKEAKAKGLRLGWLPPQKRDIITLGFDGSESGDATVLIACRVSDGYVFPIRIWEAPDTKAAKHWRVDKTDVDATVRKTFRDYRVVGFIADQPFFADYIDNWERDFGDTLPVSARPGRAIAFETKQHAEMEKIIERTHTAISDRHIRHGNHKALTRHVMNARRWKRPSGAYVIGKERHGSPKKMDAAIGMALAYEACARYRKQYIETKASVPVRVR
jgi:hypothetical protein